MMARMSSLHQLIYCSRNMISAGEADMEREIREILHAARRRNRIDGITGALLFTAGCFAQVLEGSCEAIEHTFERIECDPRHAQVTVLRFAPIAERSFPNWAMAFAGHAPAKAHGAHLTKTLAAASSGLLSEAGHDVLDLLRSVMRREEDWAAA